MTTKSASDITANVGKKRPGSWIPFIFFGLFGVVVAVNGTMIVIAVSTFNGLETTSAYEKGLAYNERLAAAAEQEQLGWQASLDTTSNARGEVVLTLDLTDRLAAPITGGKVRARLDRPLQEGFDQTITLAETKGGQYAATVELPLDGQWNIHLIANARNHHYQLTQRIQTPK